MSAGSIAEGSLVLRPGRACDAIGARPAFDLQGLLAGRAADAAGQLLPALFSLCGGAHRLAAQLALAAARGTTAEAAPALRHALDRQTLAEHLRRLWIDWPRRLGAGPGDAASLAALAASPALRADGDAAAIRAWLAAQVYGQPGADWLAAWQARDDRALDRWLAAAATLPAALLRPQAARARRWLRDADPPLPAPTAAGAALAAAAAPCETGSWTRAGLPPPRHALDRLTARLAEIARLAPARDDAPLLAAAGVALGAGHGLGWCEMARGLLVHELRLDASGACIARYRVLAPTEWNFHPRGVAARALAALPAAAAETPAVCALLAAALDPCVEYRVDTQAPVEADAHA